MQTNPITYTDEEVEDILETALNGGINYWTVEVDRLYKYPQVAAITYREPDDDSVALRILGPHQIIAGARLIESIPDFAPGIRDLHASLYDTAQIDSEVADAIVQAAIFGRIVFG